MLDKPRDDEPNDPAALAPWFHNRDRPDGRQTAPDHRFGDVPCHKWVAQAPCLPADLAGWRAFDIGCDAGFYRFQLARRAAQGVGLDADPRYLGQARSAARRMGLPGVSSARARSTTVPAGRSGSLSCSSWGCSTPRATRSSRSTSWRARPKLLVFQTLTADPGQGGGEPLPPFDFEERGRLAERDFPFTVVIEGWFAQDPTH